MSDDFVKRRGFGGSLTPFVLVVVVALSFVVGVLWQKVQSLEKQGVAKVGETTAQTGSVQPTKNPVSLNQVKALFKEDLVIFGDEKKKVIFVEVADPSCPYCHIAAGKNPELSASSGNFKYVADGGNYVPPVPEMRKLVDQGKAAYIFIYSPGHGNGEMGTKALYCAHEKGKFWAVHDLLYTNKGYELLNNVVKNDKTKSGELADFLADAINPSDLKECLEKGKYDNRLQADTALAGSLGITGTPGFLVNETTFAGAYSWKDMQPVVDQALK